MPHPPAKLNSLEALMEIVAALRGPNGCPWDKDQTHQSLTQYAIEETFELVESIEQENDNLMKEELGDVLFQVALHSQLALERKAFSLEEVIVELNAKMIRRHPHVFGNESVETKQEVLERWETIKKKEKEDQTQENAKPFSIPEALPSLQRSYKIGDKTHKSGFDWSHPNEVKEKIFEEIGEIEEILVNDPQNKDLLNEEIGDLLFSVAQYSRHLGIDPETSLRMANRKFENRYSAMLKLCQEKDLNFNELPIDEKEQLWKTVKMQNNN